MMLPDDPNWQMTVFFLLALAVMGFVMKLVALLLPAKREIERRAVSWVLISPDSVLRAQRATGPGPVVPRILMLFAAGLLSYWIYWQLVRGFQIHGILLSYLAVPFLLLIGESLVAIGNLFLLPCGYMLPALHCRPWAARSIADFWGSRWNLWASDWFRYVIFGRLRRRPMFALFLVFAASGVMHECVINVPLYCVTGRILFGTMMAYFLLQAVGILVERHFLNGHPRLMVMFVWLVVFVPLPLVLNEGYLRVLQLWPDSN
jgi:membrane bound O-acyltransferase family protein